MAPRHSDDEFTPNPETAMPSAEEVTRHIARQESLLRTWVIVVLAVVLVASLITMGVTIWAGLRSAQISQRNHTIAVNEQKVLQFIADIQNPNSDIGKKNKSQTSALVTQLLDAQKANILKAVNDIRAINHLPPLASLDQSP